MIKLKESHELSSNLLLPFLKTKPKPHIPGTLVECIAFTHEVVERGNLNPSEVKTLTSLS